LVKNNPEFILEPSVGRENLVQYFLKKGKKYKFDMYEIDNTIELLPDVEKLPITFCDFLKQTIPKKYDTIIGNPPYVKTKTGNLFNQYKWYINIF